MGDLDKLQGTWHVTSLEIGGAATPAAALNGAHIVVTKNRFTSVAMGTAYAGTLEIGERKTPRTIDLVFTDGPEKGNRNAGIYKMTGERWTLCLDTLGGKRPARFATKKGTGLALETLERTAKTPKTRAESTTSAKTAKSTRNSPKSVPASGPASPIDGDWAMASAVFDGAPMAANMVAWVKRITAGGVTTVTAGPQVMVQARFAIDATARPHAIDYDNIGGKHNGKKQAGIWTIDGGTLSICMAPPGKPRPKEFASTKGDDRSLTLWTRI